MRTSLGLLLLVGVSSVYATEKAPDEPLMVDIQNAEGVVIKAEVLSVVQTSRKNSFLCFRRPDGDRLFLYPFSFLSIDTIDQLSGYHENSGLLVADNVDPGQLEFLEDYLAAEPRQRLLIELREARKNERWLEREWKRLQDQTWRLQQQVAQTKDPELRRRNAAVFLQSLAARDQYGKKLSLCQANIRRLEERVALLRSMGVDIKDDPFAGDSVNH